MDVEKLTHDLKTILQDAGYQELIPDASNIES